MNAFTIKDLENISGIKAHTIRIWEQRYSFLRPQRSKTNIRHYCKEELKTILDIALLRKYGYKISHIDKMTIGEVREKILSLTHEQANRERLINDLLHYMVALDLESFENVLDNFTSIHGIDKTINHLVFPFLDKIGILWMTSHLHISQEQLVSNIVRQKLLAGIESNKSPFLIDKTILLFLPEGEHQELGILLMYYLVENRGARVLYLGANVPLKDIEAVAKMKKPDYLYTHIISMPGKFRIEKFLTQLTHQMGVSRLVVSGQVIKTSHKKLPEGVSITGSSSEMLEFVAGL